MWELDNKESWAPKNWCFWTVVLEKTLESPLDCKETQPVHPEGNQSWIFIGRTDAEAEIPMLWPPDVKNGLLGKDPDARKDWRQEEKGMTEDEMVGWHHWFDEHEFEQAPGIGDGQRSLACCSPWGRKELDTTEWLNWLTERHRMSSKRTSTNHIHVHTNTADICANPGSVLIYLLIMGLIFVPLCMLGKFWLYYRYFEFYLFGCWIFFYTYNIFHLCYRMPLSSWNSLIFFRFSF